MSRPKNPQFKISYRILRGGQMIPPPQGLILRGPRLEVSVAQHPDLVAKLKREGRGVAKPIVGEALLDSGAQVTTIDSGAAKLLGLRQSGETNSIGIGGTVVKGFRAACTIKFAAWGLSAGVPRASCNDLSPHKLIAIIGRDVLVHMVMTYDGPQGVVTLDVPTPRVNVVSLKSRKNPRKRKKGKRR